MKAQNITIDINKLDTDQLKQLEKITYYNGDMKTSQQIYNRIAFINGYMSEQMEKEYIEKYC